MRGLRWLAGLVAVALFVALAGSGWHYAGQLLTPGGAALPDDAIRVRALAGGRVTLPRTPDSARAGVYGLAREGGYAQVGGVVDEVTSVSGGGTVTRTYRDVVGRLAVDQAVTVDGYYYPEDPATAFDFPLQEVTVEADLGAFPAWLDKGDGRLWAVFVHGRGAGRREGYRALASLHRLGVPTLLVTYRNDVGAPASPTGLYGLGMTEWREVEAAVRYAAAHGAQRVLLVGASMGGQIVAMFLHASPAADLVAGVVLDAPALDWTRTLAQGARKRRLPILLVPLGMAAASVRGGIRWDRLDQIARAGDFEVPILLFHGTADTTVPVAVSDDFALRRPDLVTYVRVDGAEHVGAWNRDRRAYEAALDAFIGALPGD